MGWRLTPEERRIIERTKREGEEFYASETPLEKKHHVWKSILMWIGIVFLFVLGAALIYYTGTRL